MRKEASPSPSELALDILLILFEDARGSGDLAEAIGALRGQEISIATFFRQLQRAVDNGWVEIEEPGSVKSQGQAKSQAPLGRPGRSYRLTESGKQVLRFGILHQQRRLSRAADLGLIMANKP